MKFVTVCLIAGAIHLTTISYSQVGVQREDQSAAWLLLNQSIQLASKWTVQASETIAFVQGQSQQNTFQIGASHELNKRFSVVPFGYGYSWNYPYGKLPTSIVNNEHLIWHQVGITQNLARIGIKHRLRIEERFMQNNTRDVNGTLVDHGYPINQYRFRYRFMANIPINKPTMTTGTVFANVWAEGFWSWGQNVTYTSINQKRIFIGAGYQFGKVSLVGGYYYQESIKSNGTKVENNSGYLIQMNYQLNLFRNLN